MAHEDSTLSGHLPMVKQGCANENTTFLIELAVEEDKVPFTLVEADVKFHPLTRLLLGGGKLQPKKSDVKASPIFCTVG